MLGTGIGGLALLAMAFIRPRPTLLLVGLAIIGQIGVSIGSMVLWPYTAESYRRRVSARWRSARRAASRARRHADAAAGGRRAAGDGIGDAWCSWSSALRVACRRMLWLFGVRETAGPKDGRLNSSGETALTGNEERSKPRCST